MADRQELEISNVEGIPGLDKIEEGQYFLSKIQNAIQYAIGRHDWYEAQRLNIYRLTLAAASLIFVICGIVLGLQKHIPFHFWLFTIGSASIAIIGVAAALWHFNAELDGDRPYRLVSDIRFWYYRYNLPQHSSSLNDKNALERGNAVLTERKKFFIRLEENMDLKKSIREDLEQIFILQVLQRYKHESLTKLRWTLVYIVVAFCLQVVYLAVMMIT